MKKIIDDIAAPTWWLSVVVAGLLVNLASAYLKPRLDAVLLRGSAWWRSKSKARTAKRKDLVEALRDNDGKRRTAYLRAIAERLSAAEWLMLTLVCFGLSELTKQIDLGAEVLRIIALIVSLVCFAYGLGASWSAQNQFIVIREAETDDHDKPSAVDSTSASN